METKICKECKQLLAIKMFGHNGKEADGNIKYKVAAKRAHEKFKLRKEHTNAYYAELYKSKAYQIKNSARGAVHRAIKNGTLIKPAWCMTCGKEADIIEAHHADYSKPLDVIFLCKKCHDSIKEVE